AHAGDETAHLDVRAVADARSAAIGIGQRHARLAAHEAGSAASLERHLVTVRRLEIEEADLALEAALDGGDTHFPLRLVLAGPDGLQPLAARNRAGQRVGVEERLPHTRAGRRDVAGAFDLHPSSVLIASAMRRMPSLIVSRPVAYESLMCASEPKSAPATVAMRASSSRKAHTSAEPFSVPPFQRLP